VEIIDYHMVPVDTTEAAATSLDSKMDSRKALSRSLAATGSAHKSM
jgi:hypothetical protein